MNNDRGPIRDVRPEDVRRLRLGHGANCSSIGSVVDTLFATAVVGTALFAAVVAALSNEPVKVAHHDEDAPETDQPDGST